MVRAAAHCSIVHRMLICCPLQRLQQHMNRAIKRHAQMTGREVPTARELEENLRKREVSLEAEGMEYGLGKRYISSEWSKSKTDQAKASGKNKTISKAAAAKAPQTNVSADATKPHDTTDAAELKVVTATDEDGIPVPVLDQLAQSGVRGSGRKGRKGCVALVTFCCHVLTFVRI